MSAWLRSSVLTIWRAYGWRTTWVTAPSGRDEAPERATVAVSQAPSSIHIGSVIRTVHVRAAVSPAPRPGRSQRKTGQDPVNTDPAVT
jgi:hypothetical protein